jgi:dihydrodipicolinate synthase/N-acetylneuraminate lyase
MWRRPHAPAFYYKNVSDEGLFRTFSEIIQRVADARLRVFLYHIPQFSMVLISLGVPSACSPSIPVRLPA